MRRRKLAWAGIALVAGLITWSVSAQYQAPEAPVGEPAYYAANLGIYYRLEPYNGGGGVNPATGNYDPANPPGNVSYGARLTRYPVANSPAAYLQLEPGDMIVTLDNMAFYGPADVENHRFQTSMVFINIRTGMPQAANVYIP